MSGPESDPDARVAELDKKLRALESDGKRSSKEFADLSVEREKLLNARDDG